MPYRMCVLPILNWTKTVCVCTLLLGFVMCSSSTNKEERLDRRRHLCKTLGLMLALALPLAATILRGLRPHLPHVAAAHVLDLRLTGTRKRICSLSARAAGQRDATRGRGGGVSVGNVCHQRFGYRRDGVNGRRHAARTGSVGGHRAGDGGLCGRVFWLTQ